MGQVIEVLNWEQVKQKRQKQKRRDQAHRNLLLADAKLKW